MDLPGLIKLAPGDDEALEKISNMMGESFMEEKWTMAVLEGLGPNATPERKLFVSRQNMKMDFARAMNYQACYALPDFSACAGAYLKSDLKGESWSDIEADAAIELNETVLTPEEAASQAIVRKQLEVVSDFSWEEKQAQGGDFIHFYMLGVDKNARGRGLLRHLLTPFFDYADEHGVPCYLETYSDELIAIYEHLGFQVVNVLTTPGVDLVETCMERPCNTAR